MNNVTAVASTGTLLENTSPIPLGNKKVKEDNSESVNDVNRLFASRDSEKSFKDFEELSQHLASEQWTAHRVNNSQFSQFKIDRDSEGILIANWDGQNRRFSETGFERFCKCIDAPSKFLTKLPIENIRKDTSARLLGSTLGFVNLITKRDIITGCTLKEHPVSASDVILNGLQNANFNFRELSTSHNEKVFIPFTTDSSEPISGDELGMGTLLSMDDSNGEFPTLQPYIWRQICSNGAIARSLGKPYKFSSRLTRDKMLEVLAQKIETESERFQEVIHKAIVAMNSQIIPNEEKSHLESFMSKKLKWDKEEGSPEDYTEEIHENKNATYYNLFNYITNAAKNWDTEGRVKIQTLGGSMLGYFKEHGVKDEIFKGYTEFKRRELVNA